MRKLNFIYIYIEFAGFDVGFALWGIEINFTKLTIFLKNDKTRIFAKALLAGMYMRFLTTMNTNITSHLNKELLHDMMTYCFR